MAKYRIEQDKPNCIGCGSCVAICPDNWEMEGDKSKALKNEMDDIGCNMDAAEACPVNVIHVFEDGKKLI